ncbi:MAG: methionyl-tRNA formyltransferase [Porphyromonas sp.]|nr:methionyl-tRNA formyltransferase [Porphyromonas sp.]
MKIVFFGTPEFASYILKEIVDHQIEVAGVVTSPDRPAGRGRKLRPSDVKEFAQKAIPETPLLQPESLKDPDFIEQLKSFNADVFVVVAFRMLPREVWTIPPRGSFNLHASLLPAYRGAAPIQHAILSGEKITGVTTFLLDEDIDTGRILLQKEVAITLTETGGTLHDKLMIEGAKLVIKTLKLIGSTPEGEPMGVPQRDGRELSYAPKLFKEDRLLHFQSSSAEELHLRVRALNPYPAAYAHQLSPEDQEMKIYTTRVHPALPGATPGDMQIIDNGKSIAIQCLEGALEILELQLPSKRRMSVYDFLLGNMPTSEVKFE